MVPRIAQQPAPRGAFRPALLLETVPWLMLAAALRIVIFKGGSVAFPAEVAANAAIFIAFLLCARRMIEMTDGTTQLGYLSLRDQLILAYRILHPVGLLIVGLYTGFALIGARTLAPSFYFGFDGIAFDQHSNLGRLWSAFVAAIMLLMVVRHEQGRRPSMLRALREVAARWRYLLAGIAVAALFQILLSPVQGLVRWWVYLFWTGTSVPEALKTAVYFTFIFGFATIRLCGTVAILIVALRESYRSSAPAPAADNS
ncbi:MAG: hypothetical protein K2Y27_12240 [Xanthobacteraceae bacterium]|nr:hypothetical protein [Xanthobacteraceae bacterium]